MDYSTFLQNYGLGYRSYIYSRKLVTYDLYGGFNASDSSTTTNGFENSTETRAFNYSARLGFIAATRFPFNLYAEKRSSPTTDLSSDVTVSLDQEIERYALDGRMRFSVFDVTYAAQRYQSESDSPLLHEERDETEYTLSAGKRKDNYDYLVGYTRRDLKRDNTLYNTNGTSLDNSYDELSDQVTLQHRLKISKTLNWHTYAYYYDSSTQQQKNLSFSTDLDWRPTERYSASLSVMGSYISPDDGNASKTLGLHGTSNYRITENLSTLQSFGLATSSNGNQETSSALAQLGLQYRKRLVGGPIFGLGGYVSMNTFKTERGDVNATEQDRDLLIYTLNGSISQRFDAIRSSGELKADYYSSDSTLDEDRSRYSLQALFSTQFNSSSRNALNLYYARETIDRALTDQLRMTYMSIDEALQYNARLGISGSLQSKLGMRYSLSRSSENVELRQRTPYADVTATYRFLQQVNFKANLHVDRDLENDLVNYLASMGLSYNIRQILFSLDAYYFEQSSDTAGESDRTKILMKVSRRF